MLQSHIDRGAKATLATLEVPLNEAHRFGMLTVDDSERVIAFHEKPSQPTPMPGSSDMTLASMGVYIFETDALVEALEDDARQDTQHDFGKNIIPTMFPRLPVYSYRFYDENQKASKYWRDIGTLDAYYEANMDLCQVNPEFNLYDPAWPLRTYMPQAPPAKFVFNDDDRRGMALDSIISSGCIVSGSKVVGSVLCPNVRVHSYCTIENSILMPGRARGPAFADPQRDHRSRRADSARRRHRVPPRGRSSAAHGERRRRRGRDGGRRTAHRAGRHAGVDARGRRGREGARGLNERVRSDLVGFGRVRSGWVRLRASDRFGRSVEPGVASLP